MMVFTINSDLGSPLASALHVADASMAREVVAVQLVPIDLINVGRNDTEIAAPIVQRVAVNMVNMGLIWRASDMPMEEQNAALAVFVKHRRNVAVRCSIPGATQRQRDIRFIDQRLVSLRKIEHSHATPNPTAATTIPATSDRSCRGSMSAGQWRRNAAAMVRASARVMT